MENGKQTYGLYIPLQFWFCKESGLYLPLVSLSSSDVKIIVTFRRAEECYKIGPSHSIEIIEDIISFKPGDFINQIVDNKIINGYVTGYDYLSKKLYYIKIVCPTSTRREFESPQIIDNSIPSNIYSSPYYRHNIPYRIYNSIDNTYCTPKPLSKEMVESISLPQKLHLVNSYLYVDYVYLDQMERSKFVSGHHEYLIEQIQFNTEINVKNINTVQKIAFSHPCKSFYWIAQLDSIVGPGTVNDLFNYTSSPIHCR